MPIVRWYLNTFTAVFLIQFKLVEPNEILLVIKYHQHYLCAYIQIYCKYLLANNRDACSILEFLQDIPITPEFTSAGLCNEYGQYYTKKDFTVYIGTLIPAKIPEVLQTAHSLVFSLDKENATSILTSLELIPKGPHNDISCSAF